MTRGNLILLGVLVAVAAVWLLGHDWGEGKPTGPAPRLFPDFNREGADGIEIGGGPQGTSWTLAREGSEWTVTSAGNYPVKRAEVDRFLDAVQNLRKDNVAGTSKELEERTFTDEKNGRLVRVLRAEEPIAEFYVGKNPKSGYQDFFVRKAKDDAVYRTHTVIAKDREPGVADEGSSAPAFDWHSYTDALSNKWVDRAIWDLGNAEAEEIWLTRPGAYEAKLVKQAQDKWELVEEGKDPAPADADVADGMLSIVRRLSLEDVVGPYDHVAKEYGLDAPEITVLMKLRRKVDKPAPKEGEPKEGEKKEGEEKKDEYVTFHRSIEVGKKISRPRYDPYSDETKTEDFYAIHVGPEKDIDNPDEKARAGYVFLVRDYTGSQLRKDLSDLRAKPKEAEKGPGEGEGGKPAEQKPGDQKPADAEKKPEGGKPAGEKPADEKPADEKPAGEKPADEKPAGETEKPAGEGDKGGG